MPAPSAGDIAAARRLLMPLEAKVEVISRAQAQAEQAQWVSATPPVGYVMDVPSDSSSATYTIEVRADSVNGGSYIYCNCPSWKFQRGKGQDCKHIARVRSDWRRRAK